MSELLITLVPIALIDCLSPGRFATLALLLGTSRPFKTSLTWLSGLFLGYFSIGMLVLYGLDKVFEVAGNFLAKEWNKPVDAFDLLLQLVIGVLLIVFSFRIAKPKKKEEAAARKIQEQPNFSFLPVFLLAFIPAFLPMPGMLPYFAAIDMVLRADLSHAQNVTALLFYNLVFLITPGSLILLRYISKEKSERLFAAVTRFFASSGKRFLVIILVLFGALLIADAVAFWFGHPILPVPDAAAG